MRTEKERLLSALTQINNVIELTSDNQDKDFILEHLNSVETELHRQLYQLICNERERIQGSNQQHINASE
jgi:predicted Zn-ribbon and HTH transcriptional regulator